MSCAFLVYSEHMGFLHVLRYLILPFLEVHGRTVIDLKVQRIAGK